MALKIEKILSTFYENKFSSRIFIIKKYLRNEKERSIALEYKSLYIFINPNTDRGVISDPN